MTTKYSRKGRRRLKTLGERMEFLTDEVANLLKLGFRKRQPRGGLRQLFENLLGYSSEEVDYWLKEGSHRLGRNSDSDAYPLLRYSESNGNLLAIRRNRDAYPLLKQIGAIIAGQLLTNACGCVSSHCWEFDAEFIQRISEKKLNREKKLIGEKKLNDEKLEPNENRVGKAIDHCKKHHFLSDPESFCRKLYAKKKSERNYLTNAVIGSYQNLCGGGTPQDFQRALALFTRSMFFANVTTLKEEPLHVKNVPMNFRHSAAAKEANGLESILPASLAKVETLTVDRHTQQSDISSPKARSGTPTKRWIFEGLADLNGVRRQTLDRSEQTAVSRITGLGRADDWKWRTRSVARDVVSVAADGEDGEGLKTYRVLICRACTGKKSKEHGIFVSDKSQCTDHAWSAEEIDAIDCPNPALVQVRINRCPLDPPHVWSADGDTRCPVCNKLRMKQLANQEPEDESNKNCEKELRKGRQGVAGRITIVDPGPGTEMHPLLAKTRRQANEEIGGRS